MEKDRNTNFQFDTSLFLRIVKNNILIVLMTSLAVALSIYLFLNYFGSTKYTASCDLVVISQNSNYNGDYYVSISLNQFKSLLNSDAMKNQVLKELKEDGSELNSIDLSAEIINDSNMIVMKALADSPQGAYKILKAAMSSYKKLIKKSSDGIDLEILGEPSSDMIEISKDDCVGKAAIAFEFITFLGILVILLATIFRDRIQNANQVDRMLDTKALGTVYYEKKRKKEKSILISHPNVSGFYIDNMGKIATKVAYKLKQDDEKVFLVTSVSENEGKSTIASNLALTLAKRGNKVLLLDMDLKKPAIYKIFDMQKKEIPTIVEYILGEKTFDEVVIPGEEKNLFFCLGNTKVSNSDQLLDRTRLNVFFEKAKQKMDYVIVDTAPCSVTSDVYMLCKLVPDVLLVIWQDRIKIQLINDCLDDLSNSGGKSIGAIVNGVVSTDGSVEKRIVGD